MVHATDRAWKFGCGRYIQSPEALKELQAELERLGGAPFIIAGPTGWKAVLSCYPGLSRLEKESFRLYSGACCASTAEAYAAELSCGGCQSIVGIGGGKMMDFAKLVGQFAKVPVINIPTISATCAAYTPLSVLYDARGRTEGSWFFQTEVDCVIADTTVLARQPARHAAAGIMDSMAKACEIAHHGSLALQKADMRLANAIANDVFDRLYAIYRSALRDIRRGEPTQAVEELVYLTIAATGIISGVARGSLQTAIAHALYEVTRELFPAESSGSLHGEIVGYGLNIQTQYTRQRIGEVAEVSRALHMPVALPDIGLKQGDCRPLVKRMVENMSMRNKTIDGEKLFRLMSDGMPGAQA